ncbi:MAG: hypothetical protein GY803_27165 [Chloroflexi bacterium]|nr:hypothetical protein [Chloroflexota bacterium]
MSEALFKEMAQSIVDGGAEDAERLVNQAIAEDVNPLDAINKGFVRGLDDVGEQFGCGVMFLPDLGLATEAMKTAVAILEPELAKQGATPMGAIKTAAIDRGSIRTWQAEGRRDTFARAKVRVDELIGGYEQAAFIVGWGETAVMPK